MKCPGCGTAIQEDWNYCSACGRMLKCPECGNRDIWPKDTQCRGCGFGGGKTHSKPHCMCGHELFPGITVCEVCGTDNTPKDEPVK